MDFTTDPSPGPDSIRVAAAMMTVSPDFPRCPARRPEGVAAETWMLLRDWHECASTAYARAHAELWRDFMPFVVHDRPFPAPSEELLAGTPPDAMDAALKHARAQYASLMQGRRHGADMLILVAEKLRGDRQTAQAILAGPCSSLSHEQMRDFPGVRALRNEKKESVTPTACDTAV